MSTFALIPGAGGVAWYWHRVVALLEAAGHEALAVDLPGDDERATFSTYADLVVGAIGTRRDVVLVAQSLGGFTAPLVCARTEVSRLIFVNAMIPLPHEKCGDWGDKTGATEARTEAARAGGYTQDFDVPTYFFHDVPSEITKAGERHDRPQTEAIFQHRCEFDRWPAIPIHAIAGSEDRFFPLAFQRRVARQRLDVELDVVAGGHLVALSNPTGLVERVLAL